MASNKILMQFDGGSRGNPGISGAGAVIFENNEEVANVVVEVGNNNTNNQAEYIGLIEGLKLTIECGYKNICVQGDSKLVINQVENKWDCKSSLLIPLLKEVKDLIDGNFDSITFSHIYRRDNKRADELANNAMDLVSSNLKTCSYVI